MPKYNEKKYQFGRVVSNLVFNTAFHPTIMGQENIPSQGPLIFCGNHLHVWDQYPVMCATKVTIHWMAKKEYFESKLGPIFEFMGCISVDRQNNPHESKRIALEYLKEGKNIGLFAEGTRNGLKENDIQQLYLYVKEYANVNVSYEYFKEDMMKCTSRFTQIELIKNLFEGGLISSNHLYYCLTHANEVVKKFLQDGLISQQIYDESLLLPFKYGAVSMAKETDAKIVPFGVTGDYKIGNDNLTVNFGEPLSVDNDLDVGNNILRKKILTLVKENYQRRP